MKPPQGIRENVPLAPMTTYRIGGPARFFLEAGDEATLSGAFAWAAGRGLPVFLLGGGSNVLVDDAGFPGLVVRLGGGFAALGADRETGLLVAGGGVLLPRVGRAGVRRGLRGFVALTGIPGTVGGAVRMNAGTAEGEVKDLLAWAEVFRPGRGIERIPAAKLGFGYRTSALAGEAGAVVARAAFRLDGPAAAPAEAETAMKAHLAARRARQPRNPRNCGSVFRNPPGGLSAGALIERAGLKGLRIGGAEISPKHANWIVNRGDATASDVRALAEAAVRAVSETHGILLERELLYIPEDVIRHRLFPFGCVACSLTPSA